MCNLRNLLTVLLLTVLVAASDYGEAASVVNITPAGVQAASASYSIAATAWPDSAGFDLTISYDVATLGSPSVASGALSAGAILESDTGTPGVIRIVCITGDVIKGSGVVASISFTRIGTAPVPQPKFTKLSLFAIDGSQTALTDKPPVPDPDPVAPGPVGPDPVVPGPVAPDPVVPAAPTPTPTPTGTGTTLGTVTYTDSPFVGTQQKQEIKEEPKKEESGDSLQPEPGQQEAPLPTAESGETVTTDVPLSGEKTAEDAAKSESSDEKHEKVPGSTSGAVTDINATPVGSESDLKNEEKKDGKTGDDSAAATKTDEEIAAEAKAVADGKLKSGLKPAIGKKTKGDAAKVEKKKTDKQKVKAKKTKKTRKPATDTK